VSDYVGDIKKLLTSMTTVSIIGVKLKRLWFKLKVISINAMVTREQEIKEFILEFFIAHAV
jgi:hypothetical protein